MLASVASLEIVRMPLFRDVRGLLIPIELGQKIPFPVVRTFFVSGVPKGQSRGGHAHKLCHQFLVCVAGQTSVNVNDGSQERYFILDAGAGLHIPPLIFATEDYDSPGNVLAVFCDQPFDPDDYIDELHSVVQFRKSMTSGASTRQ